MKLKLHQIEVKSFVTKEAVVAGAIPPFSQIPCSAIDACPSAWICPITEEKTCILTGPGCA